MRIVFIGAPGAGKGTQSERLADFRNVPHLSTGDMLRQAQAEGTPLGKLAAGYMTSGKLVPDEVIIDLVDERLKQPDCNRGCLLDGFPRTLAQAESLDELLHSQGKPLDTVLNLHVEEDELVQRLSDRGRPDDRPETIRRRFKEFEAQTKPLLDYYRQKGLLVNIDGIGSPEEVFERIKQAVGKS